MRAVLMECAALALLLFAAGCGEGPEEVFAELRTAALEGEPKAVWRNLDAATRAALAIEAAAYYRTTGSETGPLAPESREVYEYFAGLMAGLTARERDYIRSLSVSKVETDGDAATLTLRSFRRRPPEKPLLFKKVDGRWLWDAREVLEMYMDRRFVEGC